MNLYYAVGGGLGHLTRCSAFLHTLRFNPDEFIILTQSEFALEILPEYNIQLIDKSFFDDIKELKSVILSLINDYQIDSIYFDTFPYGISGEFVDFNLKNINCYYIARILKLDLYLSKIQLNHFLLKFTQTYLTEHLSNNHYTFIEQNSLSVENVHLEYPDKEIPELLKQELCSITNKMLMVIHSEPKEEVELLINYALDYRNLYSKESVIWVFTKSVIHSVLENIKIFNYYPANNLFPYAEQIFTAAGFNSVNQSNNFRNKTKYIPFERTFDDQFFRKSLII